MKYIDAEKLKAEIERLRKNLPWGACAAQLSMICNCKSQTYDEILEFIDSLQQEQSEEPLNESEQELVDIVTERMLKEGPIPTLKGKQKADFEKEFNRFKQIAGMINWPAREEIYKKIILWFMAWSTDNLPNLGKPINPEMDVQQEQQEVDLEKEFDKYYGIYRDKEGKTHDIDDDEIVFDWKDDECAGRDMCLAHHFFELGLKAGKEE